jgi:hypothetical protein
MNRKRIALFHAFAPPAAQLENVEIVRMPKNKR